MLSILASLIIAMIFSWITYAIYGLEGVMTLQWIDQVYWAIIIVGLVLGAINTFWQCFPCQFGKWLHSKVLSRLFCDLCHQ